MTYSLMLSNSISDKYDLANVAAQPARAADAASGEQDRSDFEIWIRPIAFAIKWCGAADAQPVRRLPISCQSSVYLNEGST
jgi:hypothetical protein